MIKPSNIDTANVAVTDAELQEAYNKFVADQKQNVKPEVKHILVTADSRSDAEAKNWQTKLQLKSKLVPLLHKQQLNTLKILNLNLKVVLSLSMKKACSVLHLIRLLHL